MEPYVSDDEQAEAIKTWLKANGSAILIGVVIGLVAFLGWQYWGRYQAGQAEQASLYYDTLSAAVTNGDADQARTQGDQLFWDFPDSLYASLAALKLAKLAVDDGDNTTAKERLAWVLEHSNQDQIKDIARLRLARISLVEGELDVVKTRLAQVDGAGFTAEVEELKGDLYLARNDPEQARTAYEAASAAAEGSSSLLQIKLDNLLPTAQE